MLEAIDPHILIEERARMSNPFVALDKTVNALERIVAPAYPSDQDAGFYGLVSLPAFDFFSGLGVIGAPSGRCFLDVGCGIGSKMHLARWLGWDDVAGLDRYPAYVETARKLCPWATLQVADAFEFDGYDDFDVVYMFRPCVRDETEARLERLIVSRMRAGAIAFFPQGLAHDIGEPVGLDVWRVG